MSCGLGSIGGRCLIVLAVLFGCSSTPANDTGADACLRVRDVRGYTALHDRYVFIRAARDRHYLLEIDQGCRGLTFGSGIVISNAFDRVCSHDGATISFRDFDRTRRCRILEVEAVAGLEAAEALVIQRTAADPEGTAD
jgi:hypothetical protein